MSNWSSLTNVVIASPNCRYREHAIDTITIHCMAGDSTVEGLGEWFAKGSTKASSNYGIDSDGRIACYVPEHMRSWCSSNRDNDDRAITIEVANRPAEDPWPVTPEAYAALIKLLVDVCRRNDIPELKWKADPALVGRIDQQNMTAHRWFANKACPGDWLYDRMGQIAAEVNSQLLPPMLYKVQVGAFSVKSNAERLQRQLREAGYTDAFIVRSEAK